MNRFIKVASDLAEKRGRSLTNSGGIDPGNISRVVSEYAPDTVDIMTGAEGENGEKREDLI